MTIIKSTQKGIASLALLAMIVFGLFIMWELNEYTQRYNSPDGASELIEASPGPDSAAPPICLTGETGNCNDSNDNFLLN